MDVFLSDTSTIQDILEMECISKEIKNYLNELLEVSPQDNLSEIKITIFTPDLLPSNRETIYHTYNGMQMKSDLVYVYNISSGYKTIRQGTTASAVANAVYEIGILAGGVYFSPISVGGTFLSIFENAVGSSVVVASSSDFTQVQLKYNGVKQWTYAGDGVNWYLGYCSQKVTIKMIEEYQQFVINGNGRQKHTYQYPNATRKSSAFDSPWSIAYYNYNNICPVEEWISYKAYNLTWLFN